MKNRSFRERMGFALAGLALAWRRERSFRTKTMLAGLAVVALLVLRPQPIWWAVVALTCGMVLTLELLNSSVEALTDLLHPSIHPEVKAIKDMLAGAVLLASGIALVVAGAMLAATLPQGVAR